MPEKNKFLESALWYAKHGWAVFPITPGQKEPPLIKEWETKATTDEKQIRAWWKWKPRANVAVRTGDTFFAVDVDFRHGGVATIENLERQHGKLRDTLRQVTGRQDSSYHLLYQLPPGEPIIKCDKNVCGWAGVDLRAYHGYILVHPSIHPESKKEYFWDGDPSKKSIFDEPINPADPWLIDAIRQAQNPNGARKPYEVPRKFQKGEQEKRLIQMAGRMRYAGSDYEEILAAMTAWNETRCTEPGPPEHIAQYARSMMNYKPGDRRALAAEDQVPLALPEPLSVGELLDLEVAPPEILIDQLLPRRGATMLQGPQKVGKTIFAAQTAIAIATGKRLFENYAVRKSGPVIVVEQDDPAGDASFKDIYLRAKVPREVPLHFHRKAPVVFCEAFIEWLDREIEKRHAVAVVLDSYTALRPSRKGGGDVVKDESVEITQLDTLGKRRNCLILLLHHESTTARAQTALDWDARGAGTYAITAASESQISIARYRDLALNARERLLRARGRHLADYEMTMRLDPDTRLYDFIIEGPAAPLFPLLAEIKREITAETFTVKEYQAAVGVSQATAYRNLSVLTASGAVWKTKKKTLEGDVYALYELSRDAAVAPLLPCK